MPSKQFIPHDYQEEAIQTMLSWYYTEDKTQHVLAIPTGGGKTMIVGESLRRFLVDPTMRGLVTVPILDLVEQTRQKFIDWFFDPEDVGVVQGYTREYDRRIIIASVDTLAKDEHLQEMLAALGGRPFDAVFFDECHRSLSPSYQKIKDSLVGPYTWLCGMSATPYRADGYSLIPIFPDGIAYSISFLELIARGHLSDIHPVNVPTNLDLSNLDLEGLYDESDKLPKSIVDRIKQSNMHAKAYEAWMKFTGGTKHTIVFCQDVNDAYAWQRYVQARGHECEVVTGKHSRKSRTNDEKTGIYDRFAYGGSLYSISNFNVLSTGIDFPHVECIIIMRPMNQGLWTQAVGRGLRLSPDTGKEYCLLLNCVDEERTLMTVEKLIGITEKKEITSVREVLAEKLEKEQAEEEEITPEITHRISVAVQLNQLQVRAYNLFTGDGWIKDPLTGSFMKSVGQFGTLHADRMFTGYQVYRRTKGGRRQWIAQTAQDGKHACIVANQHLERLKIEQQKRAGNHEDLALPITEKQWNYLHTRKVGCIGASWDDAVEQGMKQADYYPLEQKLRQRDMSKGKTGRYWIINGPLPALTKKAKGKKKQPT